MPRLNALGAAFVPVLAGCGKGEPLNAGNEAAPPAAPQQGVPVSVAVHELVQPVGGQPVPIFFHMSAAEGSLASEKSCLVLKFAERTLALVFAHGTTRSDGAGAARMGEWPFALGRRARVGGSPSGRSAVAAADVPPRGMRGGWRARAAQPLC